jgi:hypothetical protein
MEPKLNFFFKITQKSKPETSFVNSTNVNPVSTVQLNAYKDNLLLTKLMETEMKVKEFQDVNQNLKKESLVLQQMVFT